MAALGGEYKVGDVGSEPETSDSPKTSGAVARTFWEHAGLTQEESAEAIKYSRETITSIVQGRRFPQRRYASWRRTTYWTP